ncbi:preprotein translocase subunit YajC [Oceanivirga salmonicida]|uniref:preprotein translocase subunit YajC n=1 Tax=Oceanivirga salmonicida TaxID=1769291 RepID=UPI00083566D3|nr:preprotein translocase subunit YajC [Oceanivirga salmonicida]
MNSNVVLLGSYAILILALFLPLYLMNKNKKKKYNEMISTMKIGDQIVTIGGIYGSVTKILDNKIEIKIDKGVSMTISKGAISRIER